MMEEMNDETENAREELMQTWLLLYAAAVSGLTSRTNDDLAPEEVSNYALEIAEMGVTNYRWALQTM